MKQYLRYKKWYKAIKESGLFDVKYYIFTYPDIRKIGVDPIKHYIKHGAMEGRNPSEHFDTNYYLSTYDDIDIKKINPLVHYILFGIKEGRNTTPKIIIRKDEKKTKKIKVSKKELTSKKIELLKSYQSNLLKYNSVYNDKVTIIILNKDGAHHLKILLDSIEKYTKYNNYQIVVLDNGSFDDSIKVLKKYKNRLPLKIEKRSFNGSFSARNNEIAKIYDSDYYVFMNNDIEVTYGWLEELLRVYKQDPNIGAVGCKLLYPTEHPNTNQALQLQHAGISFRRENGFIRPFNINIDKDYFTFQEEYKEVAAVTAALVTIDSKTFFECGMFDEKYNYGYEDVDICLKIKKLNKKILYAPSVLAFHHEFGTQNKNTPKEVSSRRLKNMHHFRKKWLFDIKKKIFNEQILNKNRVFSNEGLTVAFIVTDNTADTTAGDYFTAKELGSEFEKFGWNIKYLSKLKGEWELEYNDVDIVISLLHNFNPITFKSTKSVLKIAWARNWFDKWCEAAIYYDLVYASSKIACDFMKERLNIDIKYLPIATNNDRFHSKNYLDEQFQSDYCFTGSYWGAHREIIDLIDPTKLPQFKFSIYGHGWEQIEKFTPYYKGFLNYEYIPKVYANTKIVIDDANHVTKPYGSVNSRVFDALCSGVLVITNGKLGSFDIFDGKLPYFETQNELNDLLRIYLNDENKRNMLVQELQAIVLSKNLYKHRAKTLKNDFIKYFNSKKYLLKLPIPKWEEKNSWGDYHFGVSVKKYLERAGCPTKLQILPNWNDDEGLEYENVLVLRGLSKYTTKSTQKNIMWNISHPDKITTDEYNTYDKVYIASYKWTEEISKKIKKSDIKPLIQCTDPEVFKIPTEEEIKKYKCDILFVGNSRKIYRKVVKYTIDILQQLNKNIDFRVYGKDWEEFIDTKYIYGEIIPNVELYKYYGSAKIVLNDHWEDMREKGFVSNRIFDVVASGGFVITDEVEGLEMIFGNSIVTYSNKIDLKEKINFYLNNPLQIEQKIKKARDIVLNQHTFQMRVDELVWNSKEIS